MDHHFQAFSTTYPWWGQVPVCGESVPCWQLWDFLACNAFRGSVDPGGVLIRKVPHERAKRNNPQPGCQAPVWVHEDLPKARGCLPGWPGEGRTLPAMVNPKANSSFQVTAEVGSGSISLPLPETQRPLSGPAKKLEDRFKKKSHTH